MAKDTIQCDFCLSSEARYRLRTISKANWFACIACLPLINARKEGELSARAWHKFVDSSAPYDPDGRKPLQAELRRAYTRFFEIWTGSVEELPHGSAVKAKAAGKSTS
jgi:hypothetical protein